MKQLTLDCPKNYNRADLMWRARTSLLELDLSKVKYHPMEHLEGPGVRSTLFSDDDGHLFRLIESGKSGRIDIRYED